LIMGVFSPFWMRSIDTYGTLTADKPIHFEPGSIKHTETETYTPTAQLQLPREVK